MCKNTTINNNKTQASFVKLTAAEVSEVSNDSSSCQDEKMQRDGLSVVCSVTVQNFRQLCVAGVM